MKKIAFIIMLIPLVIYSQRLSAANFTFGLGPMGNVFVVDSSPELGPGVGGYLYFDYRWSPQLSTTISVIVTTEDGTGISGGDNGIEFLGIPTIDLKYYVLTSESRWDPYIQSGVGIYAISEGITADGTVAVGFGANFGLGLDYYLNEKFSVGTNFLFRSIGLIDSTSGNQNGKAVFPFSMAGNVAYHF